jgi:hypothetical protein
MRVPGQVYDTSTSRHFLDSFSILASSSANIDYVEGSLFFPVQTLLSTLQFVATSVEILSQGLSLMSS